MNRTWSAALVALAVAACAKPAPEQQATKTTEPEKEAPAVVQQPAPAKPESTAVAPTVDPKSSAAAEELVRGFTRLIDGGKLDEAYMLLGPNAPPRGDFDRHFADITHLRATSGAAGDQEGAAGSIYVSVPLTIAGQTGGKPVERSATAVLRRVNDVPGSTEAQRHWHIERIDWK